MANLYKPFLEIAGLVLAGLALYNYYGKHELGCTESPPENASLPGLHSPDKVSEFHYTAKVVLDILEDHGPFGHLYGLLLKTDAPVDTLDGKVALMERWLVGDSDTLISMDKIIGPGSSVDVKERGNCLTLNFKRVLSSEWVKLHH